MKWGAPSPHRDRGPTGWSRDYERLASITVYMLRTACSCYKGVRFVPNPVIYNHVLSSFRLPPADRRSGLSSRSVGLNKGVMGKKKKADQRLSNFRPSKCDLEEGSSGVTDAGRLSPPHSDVSVKCL